MSGEVLSQALMRHKLGESQSEDAFARGVIEQLRRDTGPSRPTKRPEQSAGSLPMPTVDARTASTFRLNAADGVLEKEVKLPISAVYVPYIPTGRLKLGDQSTTWRLWIMGQAHKSNEHAHRTFTETFGFVKRMAYWPGGSPWYTDARAVL